VKSDKFEKNFSLGTLTASGFVVRLVMKYMGKPGKVVLHEIYIITSEGKKYAAAVDSKDKFADKLISPITMDRKEYNLKNGDLI
jgi:hypothetical protein